MTISEEERLSLKTSEVIAELANEEMAKVPGLSFSAACHRVLAREPHLRAGYGGDTEKFAELSGRGRETRMASPGAGTRERRFRRAGPPRALSRRPIRSKAELRPGETLLVHMAASTGEPVMFAETLG